MKRTDPTVRKRCREVHGDEWWNTDSATKRVRQDEALAFLSRSKTTQNASTVKAPSRSSVKATSYVPDVTSDTNALNSIAKRNIPNCNIVSITPVDNASMRKCYEALVASFGTHLTEKRWLFHGTHGDTVNNIVTTGFNRSYSGKNATVYGISYSSQGMYSPADAKGIKTIIAARVFVGRYHCGTSSTIEPGTDAHGAPCHTTVDQVSDPSIFVVYKDFQAIPEYVIKLAV